MVRFTVDGRTLSAEAEADIALLGWVIKLLREAKPA